MKNFFLFCISLLLALSFAELYLRWNPPEDIYMVTRNIVQHTHSEPTSNPRLPYVPKANFSKKFKNREFDTSVTINSRHMRDREYPLQKRPEIKRIAVTGDSYVFGWGVESHEMFTEILEDRLLKNVEVLNFGVSGYSGSQKLERIKVHAVAYQPDIVLFLTEEKPGYSHATYQWHQGRLYWGSINLDRLTERIKYFLLKNVYLLSAIYGQYSLWRDLAWPVRPVRPSALRVAPENESEESIIENENQEARQILSELEALSLKHGFDPIVVYFPLKEEPMALEAVTFLRQESKKNGIDFLDLTGPLEDFQRRSGESIYFHYDEHWNRKGHEGVAYALNDYLRKSNLFSPEWFKKA